MKRQKECGWVKPKIRNLNPHRPAWLKLLLCFFCSFGTTASNHLLTITRSLLPSLLKMLINFPPVDSTVHQETLSTLFCLSCIMLLHFSMLFYIKWCTCMYISLLHFKLDDVHVCTFLYYILNLIETREIHRYINNNRNLSKKEILPGFLRSSLWPHRHGA